MQLGKSVKRIVQLGLLVCIVFVLGRLGGWIVSRRAVIDSRKPILAELDRLGAHYYYDYQLIDSETSKLADEGSPDIKKHWLVPLFDRDWFHDVFYVTFAKLDSHRTDGAVAMQQSHIDDRTLLKLSELRGLRWLALTGTGISDLGMVPLSKLLTIERLWLSQTQITNAGLKQLASMSSLTHLSIEATPTSDHGLAFLVGLPKLRSLSLGSPLFTSAGLRQLQQARSIEHLYLDRLPVDDSVLAAIAELRQIRTLSLRQTAITDEGLGYLKRLQKIKELRLDGCRLSDAALLPASEWKELEIISFANTRIGDQGLHFLAGCRALRSIRVSESACTLTGVIDLLVGKLGRDLPKALTTAFDAKLDSGGNVTSVNLSPVRITDSDIELLSGLQQLQWLTMQNNELTDAGARRIAELGFPHLRMLKLDNARITDDGLESLSTLTNLRDLHIRQTLITPQALVAMQASKPFLRIYNSDSPTNK